MPNSMRVLGLDPGLIKTGWGIIEVSGTRISHIANGVVRSTKSKSLAGRLVDLHDGLQEVMAEWQPETAAVEETFQNRNPSSSLKLGHARAISLVVPALAGIPVAEYAANYIKKSVVGVGHAGKEQVFAMVRILLPGIKIHGDDAADALAVAICHAHNMPSKRYQQAVASGGKQR